MPDLVGRAGELAALAALVDAPDARVGVLVGEPGIGKSTLLDAVTVRAARAGCTVLRAAPREVEAELAFSCLADLLDLPGVREVLLGGGLPPPQRAALSSALLLTDAVGVADDRAVAAGVRSLLRELAAEAPVLLVVDDAQWLDPASSLVLQHAVRRLTDQAVTLLVGTRPTVRPDAWPPGADGQVHRIELSGLSEGEVYDVVRSALGVRLPRALVRAVTTTSGGNPMYAVELARSATLPDGSAATLDALVGEAVRRLPDATRRVLLLAALAAEPSPGVLAAASSSAEADVRAVLDVAAAADVAWWEAGRVRFRHPLLAAAVVAAAGPTETANAHQALARHDTGAEARARHLALATTRPDPEVAAQVAAAARSARDRGARVAALELGRAALAVLPATDPASADLRLEVARWALRDGDLVLSRELVTPLLDAGGGTAARAHLLLTRVAGHAGARDDLVRHGRAAVELAADQPLVRVEALLLLADDFDDLDAGLAHAAEARAILEPLGPEAAPLLTTVLQAEGALRLLAGDPAGLEPLRQAADREADDLPEDLTGSATFAVAQQDLFAQQLGTARAILTRLLQVALGRGDESAEPSLRLNLAHVEIRAGRFGAALAQARAVLAVAEVAGMRAVAVLAAAQVAEAEARDPDPDVSMAALERLDDLCASADEIGEPWLRSIAALIAGRAVLESGRPAEAVRRLRTAQEVTRSMGLVDLAWNPYPAELAEALLAAGDVDAARVELADLERRPGGLHRPHVDAVLPRVRAQLLAADGDLDGALVAVDEALRAMTELGSPFELARTRLVAGRLLRRARQKRRAHDELSAAADALDALGVPRLAARARDELARVGLRPSAPATLTETEQRVADLAAAGRTNKEIAAALFLSPKTVEGVLGRVYRKLGVRSRVELARVRDDS